MSYENRLVILSSFIFGFVIFDRMALNFLVPFFESEMDINNTKIALLSSSLAFAWAISGYLTGRIADRTGQRKKYLVISIIGFSLCSVASGIADTFLLLLLSRIVMGLLEGPVLPLTQSLVVQASSASRRGLNMGLGQTLVANILSIFLPLIVVWLATTSGWRTAFFIAGIPGLLLAAISFFVIREQKKHKALDENAIISFKHLLAYPNVLISVILGCCMMSWTAIQLTFMPKYFIAVKHFTPSEMSFTMSLFAVAVALWGILVPLLSDRYGRKPVVITIFLLSILTPTGVMISSTDSYSFLALIMTGSAIMGGLSVVLGTIPSEAVPVHLISTTLGLVIGFAEIAGGCLSPLIGGMVADKFGLHFVFIIAIVLSVLALVAASFLKETAPVIITSQETEARGNA